MKLVIKYLDRLKHNILLIDQLRSEHKRLVNIIEKEDYLTKERIKQMRATNDKVYEVMLDEGFLNAMDTGHSSLSGRKLVSDWLNEQKEPIPSRVVDALTCGYSLGHRGMEGDLRAFKYMDEINKRAFMRCRNVGEKAWIDFCKLAGFNPDVIKSVCPECGGKDVRLYRDHLCCYDCGHYFKQTDL